MADDDYEEISEEEKLQIAQHFLLSSPPGQFSEVLADVKAIVPKHLLNDPMVAGIRRAFSLASPQLVPIDGSEQKLLLCMEAEVNATHYVDAGAGVVRSVDHLAGTAGSSGSALPKGFKADADKAPLQAALQAALQEYLEAHYVADAGVGVYHTDGALSIVIAGTKLNLRNYWAGSWNSSWQFDGTELTGKVKIRGHYFEDGNVQLQVEKDIPAITVARGSKQAEEVVKAISEAEQALQRGLEESYQSMSETTLQAIRRVMPITRTKMVWNLAAHRMTSQLKG
uniref:F-actin-capping protein subunit alpha n=1 Tax=Pinguiococcus pyrenoidosus TaxID=172671 RepID=A0A7R9YCR6_9STRA